ncbi:MAG TPA: hypothetical protein VJU81_06635 [Methylomirabilota bacterium]|nr:hypothetical protein [Methylomirabilota bacterium]
MTGWVAGGALALAALLGAAPAALAQPLELKTPPPESEKTGPPRPLERDIRPMQPPVPQEPAYVPGLSGETERGTRYGVSGWTAPNPPVGSRGAATPESSGSAGFGFSVEWF